MDNWAKPAILLGGAAGIAALAFCLLQQKEASGSAPAPKATRKAPKASKPKQKWEVNSVTKEQVVQILEEIIESQREMREHLNALSQELLAKPMSFESVYKRLKAVKPEDPLDLYSLSMMEFDTLLSKFQQEPEVRQGMAKIMGVPAPGDGNLDRAGSLTESQVVEIHRFMLEELEKIVHYYQNTLPDKESYQSQLATLAAQAIVGSKVEDRYSCSSTDLEHAVIRLHTQLVKNEEFNRVTTSMQTTMATFVGA